MPASAASSATSSSSSQTVAALATMPAAVSSQSSVRTRPMPMPRPARPSRPSKPVPPLPRGGNPATARASAGGGAVPERPARTQGTSTTAQTVADQRPARPPYPPSSSVRSALPPLPPPPTRRSTAAAAAGTQQARARTESSVRNRPAPPPRRATHSALLTEHMLDGALAAISAASSAAPSNTTGAMMPSLAVTSSEAAATAAGGVSSGSNSLATTTSAALELPPSWEAREDQYGRTFYINHQSRVTTWTKPTAEDNAQESNYVQHRIQLNRRYASMRRNYGNNPGGGGGSTSTGAGSTASNPASHSGSTSSTANLSVSSAGGNSFGGSASSDGSTSFDPVLAMNRYEVSSSSGTEESPQRGPNSSGSLSMNRTRTLTPLGQSPTSLGQTSQTLPTQGSTSHSVLTAALSAGSPATMGSPEGGGNKRGSVISMTSPSATPSIPAELSSSPAVRFLLRQDFYTLVGSTPNSQSLFYDNRTLVEKVRRVRENPALFSKFMHHKDIVSFINTFADSDAVLPGGWGKKLDKEGKPFFIDHNTRVTSYIDPRLPVPHAFSSTAEERSPEPDATAHPHARQVTGRGRDPRAARGPGRVGASPGRVGASPSRNQVSRVQSNTSLTSDGSMDIDQETAAGGGPAASAAATRVLSYNEQVVEFLRQPNVVDVIKVKQPDVDSNMTLVRTINRIGQGGVSTLERLGHDIDLAIMLSLFDEEIRHFIPPLSPPSSTQSPSQRGSGSSNRPQRHGGVSSSTQQTPQQSSAPTSPQRSSQSAPSSTATASAAAAATAAANPVQQRIVSQGRTAASISHRQDFGGRLVQFNKQLATRGCGKGPRVLKINVTRENILQEAYQILMREPAKALSKAKLEIMFKGEEGLDYGGPSREFFFLLSREVFNPYYGLFEYSANDTYTLQISPMSAMVDGALDWFRFCGRVIALALIHQRLLDAFFTRPFYKFLLGCVMDLSDIESVDEEYHRSLSWISENNIDDAGLDLYFTVEEEVFGQSSQNELKPGGGDIAVTDANKSEYIDLLVRWRLDRGVSEQRKVLLKGFTEVIEADLLSVFDARELELAIAGTVEVDVDDWQKNTLYRSGYHQEHPVIKKFWVAIRKMNNESRLRLLQFVTGTSSIPFEGFGALRGSSGPRKFTIECWGAITSLPRSHTCFNRLDLPAYETYKQLIEKLTLAIEETSSFGLE
eukprot:scpid27547/ scgid5804/ E3 ubiquitin-protein ligase HECW2; HECT, C2 and WW domain-containing protein 2; NEDD4-like E3 ubiquitin-protein ligase 2